MGVGKPGGGSVPMVNGLFRPALQVRELPGLHDPVSRLPEEEVLQRGERTRALGRVPAHDETRASAGQLP